MHGRSPGGRSAQDSDWWTDLYRPLRRLGSAGRQPSGYSGQPRRSGGWRSKSPAAKVGYTLATLIAVVGVVASLGGFVFYQHLNANITKVKVDNLSGKTVYGALNILILGSQTRLGQRGHFGQVANPGVSNSDNLLLVHLDPTHTHAIVISIPRDTMVYEPACKKRAYVGTGTSQPQLYPPGAIIDGALNIGGPACSVATVEALTGISLDHFVEFNFNSFRTMVHQIGGVTVCVPQPGYHDVRANLNLSPGLHHLDFGQALAYVRARHSLGGPDAGGDLPRILLQQAFISSVIQQVHNQGLLSNVPRLLGIANTATKSLTIDDGIGSPSSLLRLARSLENLKPKNVTLITMPTRIPTASEVAQHPDFNQRLLTVQPQDDVLFQMIRTGQQWKGSLPVEPPSSVQVRVVNATGRTGLAKQTAQQLRQLGFDVIGTGNAPFTSTTTVDYEGLTQADGAYTLMTKLTKFPSGLNTLPQTGSQVGSAGAVTLLLGADFGGVKSPPAAPSPAASKSSGGTTKPSAAPGPSTGASAVQQRRADLSICKGL
ncbi:MAG: LCP family protein, partial [Actinobacteria bacterium]|nr:LCP family protein [Actinomycetota bacterium]